jgi:hypothetical protein
VLTRQGLTAWRRTLAQIAPPARPFTLVAPPATSPAAVATLAGPVATELVNALAAIALAGT